VLGRVSNQTQLCTASEARLPVHESKTALNVHVLSKGTAW
jgi:hypothetical protein